MGLGARCPHLAAQRGHGDPKSALQVDGVLLKPPTDFFFFFLAQLYCAPFPCFPCHGGFCRGGKQPGGLLTSAPLPPLSLRIALPSLFFTAQPSQGG